jgi:hypothetical protein
MRDCTRHSTNSLHEAGGQPSRGELSLQMNWCYSISMLATTHQSTNTLMSELQMTLHRTGVLVDSTHPQHHSDHVLLIARGFFTVEDCYTILLQNCINNNSGAECMRVVCISTCNTFHSVCIRYSQTSTTIAVESIVATLTSIVAILTSTSAAVCCFWQTSSLVTLSVTITV